LAGLVGPSIARVRLLIWVSEWRRHFFSYCSGLASVTPPPVNAQILSSLNSRRAFGVPMIRLGPFRQFKLMRA